LIITTKEYMEYDPVEFGEIKARVAAMERTIEKMGGNIELLLEIANKGKGAWAMSMGAGSVIGAILALFGDFLLRR
jgi:hypothetical protein